MNRLLKKLEKIGRDPKVTAKAVGLTYISDSTPGYTRKRSGGGFVFYDADGKVVKDKELTARFKALVIPPAYTNVWISPKETGHLQFTGVDAAGRKQYRYHPQWNKIRNQSKYHRLQTFAAHLPTIRHQVDTDLDRKQLDHDKVVALVVRLMELTSIRVGNESYKKLYGSFGLTTLQDRHVKFDGTKINFEFKGKKGVQHKVALQSRKLARLVKQCRDIPGKELFQYYQPDGTRCSVGSGDVNTYLKNITGEDFTAKDFRTWAGSVSALYAFKEAGDFDTVTECKRKIVSVLDEVALNLGNTRTVCKKYYVHPTVIKSYEEGHLFRYISELDGRRDIKASELNTAEQALLQILEHEKLAEAS
ncbi:DNA topoisomerase IB [Mucilaginibacter myungsuensis]|uniref:DNA topoisomerase n=1 Tax=Mucilaginibacter myungsuensis TaxID=649104 RepID=A0A929PVP1_9SPHI|nr:DNA topoisomerase IB [Mucilaginibacter myungsuensis]MBE9660307.1 DNA topoisomerase IB [Mucilaginibacter myungsuensis]MDN3600349.1 DNA topoisomerase IB [Mucilaginibacter myungsuensis]